MHPPRARAARVLAAGAALVMLLAGCGSDPEPNKDTGPSEETLVCRGKWEDLGKQVQGNDQKTNPSALAERWNNVVATINYYSSAAKDSDCGEAIDRQEQAISALTAFGAKLAPYDMELRLEQVRDQAEAYATGPRPPRPTPSPAPKGKKKNQEKPKKLPLPPKPSSIADAVKKLIAQAPKATEQQGPGWQQARVVELSDRKAVAKAIKDLRFLSSESAAYRASREALAQIRVALAAQR
jgi:hypothetical protein